MNVNTRVLKYITLKSIVRNVTYTANSYILETVFVIEKVGQWFDPEWNTMKQTKALFHAV